MGSVERPDLLAIVKLSTDDISQLMAAHALVVSGNPNAETSTLCMFRVEGGVLQCGEVHVLANKEAAMRHKEGLLKEGGARDLTGKPSVPMPDLVGIPRAVGGGKMEL